MLLAIGTTCFRSQRAADGEGGPPNYVVLMLVLESMLFFSLSDGFAHHDDDA